jgi:hypothetical protein
MGEKHKRRRFGIGRSRRPSTDQQHPEKEDGERSEGALDPRGSDERTPRSRDQADDILPREAVRRPLGRRILSRLPSPKPLLEILGLAILCLYTYYAKRQAEGIREGNIYSNRAWVLLGEVRVVDWFKQGETPRIGALIVIKNVGRTPAVGWFRFGLASYPGKALPQSELERAVRDPGMSRFVVGPGDAHEAVAVDYVPTAEKAAAILSGEDHFFIFGRIEYDNGFGQKCQTTFVQWLAPETAPVRWIQAPEGNSAD